MKFLRFALVVLTGFMFMGNAYADTGRLRGFTVSLKPEHLKDVPKFGANAVRVMLRIAPIKLQDGKIKFNLTKLKKFLDEAEKNNVAVIIDLHHMKNPNAKSYRKDRNGRSADFWNDSSNLELMKQFWAQVATMCKDRKQVIWYDLLNEPLDWNDFPSYPKKWPEWAQQLVDTIRRVDKNHEIVVEPGPGGLCWGFRTFPLLKGDKIIYSAHNYQPHAYTHQGISTLKNTDLAKAYLKMNLSWPGTYSDAGGGLWDAKRLEQELAPIIKFQRKHNARIYIGEFGVIRWAPNASQYLRDNLELFEKYGWDWTYHAFREYQGWSFEHEPIYKKNVKAKTETARAKVLNEYLSRNKQPEKFGKPIIIKSTYVEMDQNEYPDSAVGIRCDVTSANVPMTPVDSSTQGKVRYRPWGKKDGSEKRHLFFSQNFRPGYQWQKFSFSFTPAVDGRVTLMLSGVWYNDPKKKKRIDTWTCYDNIKVTGGKLLADGSLEIIEAVGKPKSWKLGHGVKLIESDEGAAHGSNYVMAALERYAYTGLIVKAGQKVTVTGMAKRAGRFERNFTVNEKKLSFVKANTKSVAKKKDGEYVILFKGNSITRHGIKASLGWNHVSGMAASSEDKDYAHLLAAMIQKALPDKKVRIVFSSQDSSTAVSDAQYLPDLVVVQGGEHSQTSQKKVDAFPAIYQKTLDAALNYPSKPEIIAVGVWTIDPANGSYGGFTKIIQDIERKCTAERNIPFVSVEKFGLDPACHGSGTNPGVKWHPNDTGMRKYAEAILAVWKQKNIK